jgi:hypothetical protein
MILEMTSKRSNRVTVPPSNHTRKLFSVALRWHRVDHSVPINISEGECVLVSPVGDFIG